MSSRLRTCIARSWWPGFAQRSRCVRIPGKTGTGVGRTAAGFAARTSGYLASGGTAALAPVVDAGGACALARTADQPPAARRSEEQADQIQGERQQASSRGAEDAMALDQRDADGDGETGAEDPEPEDRPRA